MAADGARYGAYTVHWLITIAGIAAPDSAIGKAGLGMPALGLFFLVRLKLSPTPPPPVEVLVEESGGGGH